MEAQTSFDMAEYKNDGDEMLAGVMPSHWVGHGRIKIHGHGFDDDARAFADELLAKLNDKFPRKNATKLAELAIKKTEERD